MSDQDPPIARTRRKHNKVSTGCQNCKTRRVKCDETSPGCQRCTRARLRCGGYAPPKAWIFEPSGTSLEKSDKGKSPLIKHGCDDHPVLPDLSTERWSITSFANAPNLRMVWQSALLDTFLTSWFPDGLVRHVTTDEASGAVVPMSAWPLASWKLARKDGKVFVKHALLCLVLCVLGRYVLLHIHSLWELLIQQSGFVNNQNHVLMWSCQPHQRHQTRCRSLTALCTSLAAATSPDRPVN